MVTNVTELNSRLWEAADSFRANSKLKSSEYAVPVLGLIFLKYADQRFAVAETALASQATSRRGVSKTDYQARGVMYLPTTARYAYLLDRFQEMIAEYNTGSRNVDEHYQLLLDFTTTLSHEEHRAVSEGLSEEELAIYDLLLKPHIDLTDAEIKNIKRVAHDLLETLKREKLVLDWRKRQQSRAGVKMTIEDKLDNLPQAFTSDLFHKNASRYMSTCTRSITVRGKVRVAGEVAFNMNENSSGALTILDSTRDNNYCEQGL